jgi:hypothetical protein
MYGKVIKKEFKHSLSPTWETHALFLDTPGCTISNHRSIGEQDRSKDPHGPSNQYYGNLHDNGGR